MLLEFILILVLLDLLINVVILFRIYGWKLLNWRSTKHRKGMADAIFVVLNELCNLPHDKTISWEDLLKELNKGKVIDPKYYLGPNEHNMLVNQGYISYLELAGDNEICNEKKSIMATPKAFELVEARKNGVYAFKTAMAAIAVSLFVAFVALVQLFLAVSVNKNSIPYLDLCFKVILPPLVVLILLFLAIRIIIR